MSSEVIIGNLLPHLRAWWPAIEVIAAMMGFFMIITGIGSIISQGRQGMKFKAPIASIIGGVLLLNVISLLDVLASSVFATGSATGLTYAAPGGTDPTAIYITFAVYIVMLVGLCGIIQGGRLLKSSADDGRQLGPAITHLIGGTLGVNVIQFLHLLGASMGTSVDSAITKLIG